MRKLVEKMKNIMDKKDNGSLNAVLMEAGLAVVGIALLVVLAVAGKPLVEEIVDLCAQKIKDIFTMF